MYVCKYAESVAPPLSLVHRVIVLRAINQFRFLFYTCPTIFMFYYFALRCRRRRHRGRQLKTRI